ncbi:MAG: hypothetical protein OEW68_17140 [Gammaproteobacteria bacterium]|nr:hypothetical protein [Gammaproteobacteria bacterium]MDH4316540.1 hypothetical protein [Gammaproteobacteria bacterium]MDH5215281.1 hypothetical protein [Gammaproteobacteria bacterium]MDH5501482.1 hypothetical protein [Gammaproteobacteria bacterium]
MDEQNTGGAQTRPEAEPVADVPGRGQMLRDVAVFQVKLFADGFRDLLLVPLSIGAAIVALLKTGRRPGTEFYDVLRLGRRSEHWINLFSAASHVHGTAEDDERFRGDDIDELVSKAESFVVDEYRRGGLTAQSREKLGRVFKAIHQRLRNRKG